MANGIASPPFWTDQEQKIPKQALTKFVYCDIKKPSLIVCALSVKLGAGPLAWGLPGNSIAHVVVETLAGPVDPKGCTFGERKPPSGV